MTTPPLDPAIQVEARAALETNEGEKDIVHGTLAQERVSAIAMGARRAVEEAACIARLAAHPNAPRWGRALGEWLVVPRLTQGTEEEASPGASSASSAERSGPIEDLLEAMGPAPDRGGTIDVVRALRHLELPRGPLDRWLGSDGELAMAEGPDLGGIDPRWLFRDLEGRRVCPSMRRARLVGFPDLDDAAAELASGRRRPVDPDPRLELARDLARIHVGVRETVHARASAASARASALVTEIVLARLRALPPKERRPPFREREPRRVRQRRIFSRFFEGIRHDDEGLLSATPEALALRIAEGLSGRVLDGTCGIGAISIALARTPSVREVVACDLSAGRVEMARHNARIYGVASRIRFLVGDVGVLLPRERFDAVVLDPPWGGRDYDKERVTLRDLGLDLLPLVLAYRGPLRIKLPRSFARDELPGFSYEELADERGVVKMLLASRG